MRSLTDLLRPLVAAAEADLRERSDRADLDWAVGLRAEYETALSAGRTALTWTDWREGEITQGAVAWVLGTVFVRFGEDNDLVTPRWFTGGGDGLRRAVDAESAFYAADPRRGTADWLREAFGHLADLPATGGILDRSHSPVWSVPLGDDVARDLVTFWRTTNADGTVAHSLASPDLDTRFLGDLYQDLSLEAKKKYALLQTPVFVESFILDRTLTPALAEFGLPGLRLIDPTCGSGHFLLGAFARLLAAWQAREPGAAVVDNVRRALDSVHGVDVNPFAAAIARFRLAVAALHAAGFTRLADAPAFPIHVAVGDSLLGAETQGTLVDEGGAAGFQYRNEDLTEHPAILERGRYHVVVGNPPYITVKDKALNQAYREIYRTCKGKYALSVPFMELFFALAVRGTPDVPAGYVGQITSNSFMKREFGSKVVETLLAGKDTGNPVDMLDVIDTSGAYIPGHGTPTVILVGRRRRPGTAPVRGVLGVRGEPGQPRDAAHGLVWTEITEHIDDPGFDGTYVSVADLDRDVLASHPWSLSGGGAGELKEAMDSASTSRLTESADSLGITSFTLEDDVFVADSHAFKTRGVEAPWLRIMVLGDGLRDWASSRSQPSAIFPYDSALTAVDIERDRRVVFWMWPYRTNLSNNVMFGGTTKVQSGLRWSEYGRMTASKLRTPLSIAFAFVATHNHFVLDRGGKVFKQSAPVIKLPAGSDEDDHLELLGVLNSSAACFWLKQVSYPKGGDPVGQDGARVSQQPWSDRYEFTGTKLAEFPLPQDLPLEYGRRLDDLAQRLAAVTPSAVCAAGVPTRSRLDAARVEHAALRAEMIAVQEELDWHCYRLYGLIADDLTTPDTVPPVALGERAFEIALARHVAAGAEQTAWFDRHGSTPITEIPAHWPQPYRDLVQRRLDTIDSDRSIRLLERPEFKRRWAAETWEAQEKRAVTAWILDRLENPDLWSDAQGPRVLSLAQVAGMLRADDDLREACRTLTGRQDPDLLAVLTALVPGEAVPYLAALRYSESGMTKRAEWEKVWDLQRQEDAGAKVTIPVPPKYTTKDFRQQSFWSARGKLDVPKERFVSYPGAESDTDTTLVIGWAGWDHADQARALARLLMTRLQTDGWDAERTRPLLAGLAELEPWLRQWHADPMPGTAVSPAGAIGGLLDQRLAAMGATRSALRSWRPPAPARGRRRPKGA